MCGSPPSAFRRVGERLNRHQGLWPARRAGVAVTVYRCGKCGLVFPDPMPVPEAVEALYGVEPDRYWPEGYFEDDQDYLKAPCTTALELLGKGDRVMALDVGAGIGKGVLALQRHGFHALGLEPSPEFRRYALERMGLKDDQMVLGTVEAAVLPANSFDFVNCAAVLEHVQDPREGLARVVGWTRPGGVVHVEVPSAHWLLARGLNVWYAVTAQGFVTHTSPMHPPYHLYEFTLRAFEAALAGLPCEIEQWTIWPGEIPAPGPLRGPLRWIMDATDTGLNLTVWIRRR